ncbi:hypothetical protein PIB30_071928, partial [Stylosanthes scabra]|nr:hypothetical protein [Stylosanthes scabra]
NERRPTSQSLTVESPLSKLTTTTSATQHCGICSCNSHYTDECPQLQEDNVIASSHNYYDGPPQNRQYQPQTQGWRDNQQGRWNCNQQPQYRQPYNNNPPQNSQNTRYQPPHSRQPYPSNNNSQLSYEEAFRLSQQENKEMREVAKRNEAQISHLTDLMTKFVTQMLLRTSTPPPPPPPNPTLSLLNLSLILREESM